MFHLGHLYGIPMRLLIALAAASVAFPALAQQEPTTNPATTADDEAVMTTDPGARSIAARITPSVENCSWLLRVNGTLTREPLRGIDLIRSTTALTRPTSTGNLEGVYCERDSVVPGEQDDRVPRQLGVPLFINGPGGMVTVAIKDGLYRFSISKDATITDAQREAMRNVILRWEARGAG